MVELQRKKIVSSSDGKQKTNWICNWKICKFKNYPFLQNMKNSTLGANGSHNDIFFQNVRIWIGNAESKYQHSEESEEYQDDHCVTKIENHLILIWP